jgi:hypothetical protein
MPFKGLFFKYFFPYEKGNYLCKKTFKSFVKKMISLDEKSLFVRGKPNIAFKTAFFENKFGSTQNSNILLGAVWRFHSRNFLSQS